MALSYEKKDMGGELAVTLHGRLDSTTYKDFEAFLTESLEGKTKLTVDLSALEYISSAGLRVFLLAQKLLSKRKGTMLLLNPTDTVMEIFDVTGLGEVFDIRKQ